MPDDSSHSRFAKIDAAFTPFAAASHEPRFAWEVPSTAAAIISHALHGQGLAEGYQLTAYTGYTDGQGQWLAVCSSGSFAARIPTISTIQLFSGLDIHATARAVEEWLDQKADYGEPPWFEGSEAQGMRIFQVAYGQEPSRFYGWTVIQPHWFEIHK